MTNIPQTLYHYTSLETLALILTNKSLCFNTLLNVDDIEEAETSDMGLLGKYVYVSCWTDEAAESIPMWQLYTPNTVSYTHLSQKIQNRCSVHVIEPVRCIGFCICSNARFCSISKKSLCRTLSNYMI